ncbi:NAD-binding protein [Alkalibacter mobilis]|uniref:NAD-binding protein n=1 Tax=Alkalibacter mobilis TaxID=2787712 RepID=UPI00189D3D91|nr:NAD-binding protein [Alkalibacter mobilis]MBF7097326.1 NAD-binding protein [Alkalibacter mobilis]
MDYILAVLIISFVVYFGFYLMKKLDAGLSNPEFFPMSDNSRSRHSILLFADDHNNSPIENLLKKNHLPFKTVHNSYIQNLDYELLLAISDSDIDNLQIVNNSKKHYPLNHIIVQCNDMIYENLYKELGADHIIYASYSTEILLKLMEGWII